MGSILAVLGLASLVGGMLFFGAVMAPLVFAKLPKEVAGEFIRAAFPRYYLYMIVSALVAALGFLIRGRPWYALIAAAIAAVTVWLWAGWIPHLNALRAAGAHLKFAHGHQVSMIVNAGQLIVAAALLVAVFR